MNKRAKSLIQNVILVLIVLLTIFPLFWTFLTSIKANVDAWSLPPKFIFQPSSRNYSIVLLEKRFIGFIKNSLITCVGATVLAMLLGIPLAYSFSRLKSRFKNVVFVGVFISYILPPIVLSIPLYVIFARWGVLNRYSTIILTHMTFILAFTAWMMRGFFEEVPEEIEESAILDGCSFMQCLLTIDIPMVKAGLMSTVIFSFILSWNDFMYALVLTSQSTRLVSVAVAQFLTPHGMFWGQMCAAGIIAILPILIFTLFARKSLVRGMSVGA
ncbi:MAG: carbohydrate ABC transporter permease, partial [Spirochaetales bacterium]|nr:carbohydrate ABC transporter permease [Spirochaetales bacterium]